MRRAWMLLPVILGLVLGCGKARPTGFTDKAKPLAEAMLKDVRNRKLDSLEKIVALAEGRLGNKSVVTAEYNVLKAALDYAKEDKWESAEELLTKSLAIKQ